MIAGTGITVQNIADSLHNGLLPGQMTEQFDLTMAQVYAALSYYYDHQAEIDADIDEDKAQARALLQKLETQGQATSLEALKRRTEKR